MFTLAHFGQIFRLFDDVESLVEGGAPGTIEADGQALWSAIIAEDAGAIGTGLTKLATDLRNLVSTPTVAKLVTDAEALATVFVAAA